MPPDDDLPPLFEGDPGLPTLLRAGYQVGRRYTLVRPLGQGGYGSLWEARDERTGEAVAVKVLQVTSREEGFKVAASRLRREARAYQALDHPAVTKLRNLGSTDQGEPYIVMELLEGRDLAQTLGNDGVMAPTDAVRLLIPIADALAEAHDRGLVHRDVKLGNIFLEEREGGTVAPKLIDFGLTKPLDAIAAHSLTGAGMRVGSPSYMSPEQARGRDVDTRSDIWPLSVVLYRMVTGALPFVGDSHVTQRIAIVDRAPSPFEAHGVDEPALWAIVSRGLEKQPEARWPSMRELTAALEEWLHNAG